MTEITYIEPDGTTRPVDAKDGSSLMEAALRAEIRGIEGDCGGCLSCATCHVYVDPPDGLHLPPPSEAELEMLSQVAADRRPTSRLSCQLTAAPTLTGLVLHVPDRQF